MEKMTAADMKRASRSELLEMMLTQSKEIDRLCKEKETLEKQLNDRTISIERAGTMAEASLLINGILKDADLAAKQYLENIQHRESESAAKAAKTLLDANVKAETTIREAESKAETIVQEAEKEKGRIMAQADAYWQELSVKLESFYREHLGLKELMNFLGSQPSIQSSPLKEASLETEPEPGNMKEEAR